MVSALSHSLSRPGGNVTGLSLQFEPISPENGWKSCARAFPACAGWSCSPTLTAPMQRWKSANISSPRLKRWASTWRSRKYGAPRISRLRSRSPRRVRMALYVQTDPIFDTPSIPDHGSWRWTPRCRRSPVPREYVEAGSLISYGAEFSRICSGGPATSSTRFYGGAKPSDLPVQQPTKFDLILNLKTAKALGLESVGLADRPRRRGDRISGGMS